MTDPRFFNLAVIKYKGIILKHFFRDRTASVLQIYRMYVRRIYSRLIRINEDISEFFFPREFQNIICLLFLRFCKAESRMSADRKIHILITRIADFPLHTQAAFL